MDKPISKLRITLWVITVLLFLLVMTVGSVALYIWNALRPVELAAPVLVEVASGSSPFRVAELLEEEGVIRNAFVFKYYLRYKNEGPRFQAGTYEFSGTPDRNVIIAKLNQGDTVPEETIRFTIPEGYTVVQIADKLSAKGLIDKEVFLALVESEELAAYGEHAARIGTTEELRFRLEGYLFPETYEMKAGSTERELLVRMVQELDRKLEQLPGDWQEVLEDRGLTVHQLLTIASLIEREVVVQDERPLVSGIIANRLTDGMMLQIDATVQYLLDKQKERLLYADLEVESPYNTYKVTGLPPGPIASPSLASIEAALYPEPSDYLFYVTKKDGTQRHFFARTFREHQQNIEESNRLAQEGGGNDAQ